MDKQDMSNEIGTFFCRLKEEIVGLTDVANKDHDGDMQDGFLLSNIDDGWVRYKGMSWGFALEQDPCCIDMTFGPDWPFVGYRQRLKPEMMGDLLVWIDDADGDRVFTTPQQLAKYGLEALANKVHDHLPEAAAMKTD